MTAHFLKEYVTEREGEGDFHINGYTTHLEIDISILNRAAGIATRGNFDSPATPLTGNLKWPTVSDNIKSKTAATMNKWLNILVRQNISY